ncbi:MAG: hypothetical protein ACYCUG_03725 [Acidimicrobiales bacterium]
MPRHGGGYAAVPVAQPDISGGEARLPRLIFREDGVKVSRPQKEMKMLASLASQVSGHQDELRADATRRRLARQARATLAVPGRGHLALVGAAMLAGRRGRR